MFCGLGLRTSTCRCGRVGFLSACLSTAWVSRNNVCSFTWRQRRRIWLQRSCCERHNHPRRRRIRWYWRGILWYWRGILVVHSSISGLPSYLLWTKQTKLTGSTDGFSMDRARLFQKSRKGKEIKTNERRLWQKCNNDRYN